MSRTYARFIAFAVKCITAPMVTYRRPITRAMVVEKLMQRHSVCVDDKIIHFETPSARSLHDTMSVLDGEVETIRWINQLPMGTTLWDIGANVGVYSLYAAIMRNIHVHAFEPSASSYALLNRNIEINSLDSLIDAYCIAFSDENKLDQLHMANTEAGHSMHAFGQPNNVRGLIQTKFKQGVPGFTIDAFRSFYNVEPPQHIKLDVDSIEEHIIRGGTQTLRDHVTSIIVEIEEDTKNLAATPIYGLLIDLGFVMTPPDDDRNRNVVFEKP